MENAQAATPLVSQSVVVVVVVCDLDAVRELHAGEQVDDELVAVEGSVAFLH
jgi:hypothetical protein